MQPFEAEGAREGRLLLPGEAPLKQPGEAEGGGGAATTTIITTPSETQLAHAWPWFLRGPEELHFTSGALLHQQLEEEMREVQNYVDHVRALTEARDTLAAEYERENEELRVKYTQLQLEHESQHKEVAELLALEGLASIVHSSPSEQVAYLLVERSTLLERMEALEQELGAPHCLGRPCVASLQVQDEWHLFHPRPEEGLHRPQQSLPHIRGTLPLSEEPAGGQPTWEEPERGLEGSPGRLRSTQGGIPALKEDLDAAEGERGKLPDSAGAEFWQGTLGKEEEKAQQPVEPLVKSSLSREPLSALDPDSVTVSELWKTREQNLWTDRLLLHDRLCFPEAERQASLGGSVSSDLGGCFKRELHSYKSELLRLYGELQVLQGAAEERDFLHLTHEKLLQKNRRLESRVLELSHECEQLNQRILRKRKEEEEEEEGVLANRLSFSCPEFPARGLFYEDQIPKQGGDGELMCLRCSEASKMGELGKPSQAKQEEEGPSFLKEILAVQHQLSTHRERHSTPAEPCPPRPALGSAGGDTEQGPPHKGALQPQEEPPGPLWGPRQVLSFAKEQLRLEQERSLELRLQNLQLQQENIKIQAELRQAQVKVLETSKACGALASQGELSQQKAKELELQLLQQCQAAKQQSRLQEQLAQESQRAARAEKRVQELEQMLQESRQLSETQAALGRRQLGEEAREARAKETEARRALQEEQKRRKLLEQQWEEQQQQQRRLWREEEAQLLQALADRQAQAQQQEGQLRALEEERRALAKEHLDSRRLSEQLSALQQEKEALCEEQRKILKQVDVSLRKQNKRRLRHKARLQQAKETLLDEVKLRDTHIWNLENEVRLAKSQAEKDRLLIRRVTNENESLFREKRKSLEQLHSLEEAKQSNSQALCTLQSRWETPRKEGREERRKEGNDQRKGVCWGPHPKPLPSLLPRVQLLERENQQLQDRTLQLSLQVGILERALRTIHVHSLQEFKSLGFPECPLQRKLLPFSGFSFSVTRLSDHGSLRQALNDGQPVEPGQKALLSPRAFQSSAIGCLNVSVPRNSADFREDQPGHPVG
ncbi:coiled-coil domain-containing protein 30 [Ahaetulla prasina]|uniref:coiled-coil domain-containing protein 30 n=1 Tax=Ahaetulla prasina TaxID=499056 RepID=UPI0026472FC1|nr:coiled-coil domain-containing protein 30 [Ahaetulla prasina]